MATRGFSFKGLVDYVLSLKDSFTDKINNLTANDVHMSNPNLLINGDFSVWQRGNVGTANGYCSVDRWQFFNGDSKRMSYLASGIDDGTSHNKEQYYLRINARASGDFSQSIERNFGKAEVLTTTFKIRVNKGSTDVRVRVRTMQSGASSKYYDFVDKTEGAIEVGKIITLVHTHTRVSDPSSTDLYTNCMLTFSGAGTEVDVFEAKCELGSVATPFTTDDPATNLMKCQRYYEVVDLSRFTAIWHPNTAAIVGSYPYKVSKRVAPRLSLIKYLQALSAQGTFTGSFSIRDGGTSKTSAAFNLTLGSGEGRPTEFGAVALYVTMAADAEI